MDHRRVRGGRGVCGAAAAIGLGLALGLSAAPVDRAQADSLEGAYLKARHAALTNDLPSAARFYRDALSYDPREPQILTPAFYYALMVGETRDATRLAPLLASVSPADRLARLMTTADAIAAGRYDDAEALMAAPEAEKSLLPMTRQILRGWIAFGRGDSAGAETQFLAEPAPSPAAASDQQAARDEALRSAYRLFGNLHLGLMAAAEGRDERALDAYEEAKGAGDWNVQLGVEAAGALRRLGRTDEAAAIYGALLERDRRNPVVLSAKASLDRGERATPFAKTAADGAAALFQGLGASFRSDRDSDSRSIYYLQLARHLKPDFDEAHFSTASELVDMDQMALAAEVFAGIAPQSPLGELARIGRAEALARDDDFDGARAVLNRLSSDGSERPSVYLTLGAVENAESNYAECAAAYEKALTLMDAPTWQVLLRLGVCREQGDDWTAAEAAFVEALAIEPRQPDVLNHFGYGLVEQGRRLDEAKRMIEIAVMERPESGYIVDSLGWVLYRLGDYEGAVKHLEAAVSLAPHESVINDHYGDALWRVGRRMEARFQWRRALSYEPTDEERPLIERKLEIGLDEFLAEQEAQDGAPLGKKVEAGADAAEPAPAQAHGG